jgi:micrococcal nuclease
MDRYVLLAAASLTCAPPAPPPASRQEPARDACVVASVPDGDTLRCEDGRRVRLIGIDAPERGQGPAFAPSRDRLRALTPRGATVLLEADVTPRDRYGRTLAWVWREDILVNERMVREGWAVLYTGAPDVRYSDRIRAAQAAARDERAGLWASGGFDCMPRDFRRGRCG